MKLSARNQLKGTIKSIQEGPMNSEVGVEVAPGVLVYAQISTSSVKRLDLKVGKSATAVIKIDSVMIGVD